MDIILHCSQSKYGNASIITQWHTRRGWRTCGYHFVILNGWLDSKCYNYNWDGLLETGRPLSDNNTLDVLEYGAHTKGYNKESVGVCLIGESGNFTNSQLHTMNYLYETLEKQFKGVTLKQHSDLDSRKPFCAGLAERELKFIRLGFQCQYSKVDLNKGEDKWI